MSEDQFTRVERLVELVVKLASLLRLIIGGAITLGTVFIGVILWVHNTSAQADQTKVELHALILDRAESKKEWELWRKNKDEIDFKLTLIVDDFQKRLSRMDR